MILLNTLTTGMSFYAHYQTVLWLVLGEADHYTITPSVERRQTALRLQCNLMVEEFAQSCSFP